MLESRRILSMSSSGPGGGIGSGTGSSIDNVAIGYGESRRYEIPFVMNLRAQTQIKFELQTDKQ